MGTYSKLSQFQKAQYEFVKQSRQVLLDYCSTITEADLIAETPAFGRGGSIRNLFVHIANTYEFWIGKWALKKVDKFTAYTEIESINALSALFEEIDELMETAINEFSESENREIEFQINGKIKRANFGKIFTHVITHEFHHKGQILSISRHCGYIPVDTDIIR